MTINHFTCPLIDTEDTDTDETDTKLKTIKIEKNTGTIGETGLRRVNSKESALFIHNTMRKTAYQKVKTQLKTAKTYKLISK